MLTTAPWVGCIMGVDVTVRVEFHRRRVLFCQLDPVDDIDVFEKRGSVVPDVGW